MEDYKSDDLSTKGVGVDLSHLVSFGLYQPSAGQYETIFNAFLEIPKFFLWNYYSNFFFVSFFILISRHTCLSEKLFQNSELLT